MPGPGAAWQAAATGEGKRSLPAIELRWGGALPKPGTCLSPPLQMAPGMHRQGHLLGCGARHALGCRRSPLQPVGADWALGRGSRRRSCRAGGQLRVGFGLWLSPAAVGQAGQPLPGHPGGAGSRNGGRQRFVPVLLIQAAKENGINREGKEEGTARDLPGRGVGAPWAQDETL